MPVEELLVLAGLDAQGELSGRAPFPSSRPLAAPPEGAGKDIPLAADTKELLPTLSEMGKGMALEEAAS